MNEIPPTSHVANPGAPTSCPGYYQLPYKAEDEISILDYWKIIFRYKSTIILVAILCSCIAAIYALRMTPIYQAQIVIAPVEQGEQDKMASIAAQFGGLASMTGISVGGVGGKSATALAVLKSRNFTSEFIAEEKLLPVLYDNRWDAVSGRWKVDAKFVPTLWQAFELFDTSVRTITEDNKSGIVTLAIAWKDPVLAAKWANALVSKINRFQRETAISEAENNISFLKKQLEKTSVIDMQQAIYRLIEVQTKSAMIANVRNEFAFKIIDPAVPPERKAKPNRTRIVIFGFVGGVFLGIFIAFVRSAIDKSRKTGDAS